MPNGSGERAISPVVGVVLMLAIVIALAATAGIMLLGAGENLSAPPPMAASQESINVELRGNETHHSLEFVHQGGDAVSTSSLVAEIEVGGQHVRLPIDKTDAAGGDGTWEAGERLDLDLNESLLCAGGVEEASVTLAYMGDGTSHTLAAKRVPIERGQFVINGATVEATADYTANVKFIGTGWSSETSDPPVNVTVNVDGAVEHAWRMVKDSDQIVGSDGVSRQERGTELEVAAAGAQPNMDCGLFGFNCERVGWDWTRVSAGSNTENVRVYRDGDDAPAFGSGSGQQSAAAYVDPFVEGGDITLEDNQAIYLFDFNDDDHDYQDAVVLVSFFTQEERSGIYKSRGQNVVICPPETKSANPNGGGGNGNGNNA